MAKKMLTSIGIEALRAKAKRQEIRDLGAPGLYLIVQPSGHKGFAMRLTRPDGRIAKLTLGPFDPSSDAEREPEIGKPLTLAAARRLAADVGHQRAMGRDVMKSVEVTRVADTFASSVKDFIKGHAKPKTRGWRGTAKLLGLSAEGEVIKGGLVDRWANRPLAEIGSGDIYNVVEEARQRGVPGMAAKGEGPSENAGQTSPLRFVEVLLLAPPPSQDRGQSSRVRSSSRSRSDARPGSDRCRGRQVLESRGRGADVRSLVEVALADGMQVERGSRDAPRRDRRRALDHPRIADQEQEALRRPAAADGAGLDRVEEDGLRVHDHRAVAAFRLVEAEEQIGRGDGRRRAALAVARLRRTTATGMADIGVLPHVVEACLNHVSGARAGIAGTYNRALYAEEKKAALARWSAHVAGLVAGNVVPLRDRKKS